MNKTERDIKVLLGIILIFLGIIFIQKIKKMIILEPLKVREQISAPIRKNPDGSLLPHEVVIKEKYEKLENIKNTDLCYTLSNNTKVACKNAQDRGANQVVAEEKCKELGMRLPNVEELKEIYKNQKKIPHLTDAEDMGGWPYWSSSDGAQEAVRIIFAGGSFGPQGAIQHRPIARGSGAGAYIRCVKD